MNCKNIKTNIFLFVTFTYKFVTHNTRIPHTPRPGSLLLKNFGFEPTVNQHFSEFPQSRVPQFDGVVLAPGKEVQNVEARRSW